MSSNRKNPKPGSVIVDRSHRKIIESTPDECTSEDKSSPIHKWLSTISGLDGDSIMLHELFGQTRSYAEKYFQTNRLDSQPRRHFKATINLFPDTKSTAHFSLASWQKVERLYFNSISTNTGKSFARQSFQLYREHLEQQLGKANQSVGTDIPETEQLMLIWKEGELSLTLRIGPIEREMYTATSLWLEHQGVKERNQATRADYYKCYCDIFTAKPLRFARSKKRKILKNLDIVLASAQCHCLDEGVCEDLCYSDVDSHWLETFGKPCSVLGEDYEQILIGHTGGIIRVFDNQGSPVLVKKYWTKFRAPTPNLEHMLKPSRTTYPSSRQPI